MSINQPGYPWKPERQLRPQDVKAIASQANKKIRVDPRTMEMRETAGGILLSAKPPASTTPEWFRILTDNEVYLYTLSLGAAEIQNDLRCRNTMDCPDPHDEAPSLWGKQLTIQRGCVVAEAGDPVLIYFPKKAEQCVAWGNDNSDHFSCDSQSYQGKRVLAFYNTDPSRWETDDSLTEGGDIVDWVYFCRPYIPVVPCVGVDSCTDGEDPDLATCCIYDGIAFRDYESCGYECEWNNRTFDVWIICKDTSQVPANKCIMARRISDEHELTHCPLRTLVTDPENPGHETTVDAGPQITERRPVYSVMTCGCGCPKDELYLEFYMMCAEGGDEEQVACAENGWKVTVKLTPAASGDPNILNYEGYFCRDYTVPRYLHAAQHPGDPFTIWFECDCVTGECGKAWIDSAEAGYPTGGGSYVPATGAYNATCADKTGLFDVLLIYEGGGTGPGDPPLVETPAWTTCRVCYKVSVSCDKTTNAVNIYLQAALPVGNPAYDVEVDSPDDLILMGDQQPFVFVKQECEPRTWYKMNDPVFGRQDPLTMVDGGGSPLFPDAANMCGFPHIMNHVFGDCCWDHVWVGLGAPVPSGAKHNYCSCCHTDPVALASCQTAPLPPNVTIYVKASWNCSGYQAPPGV